MTKKGANEFKKFVIIILILAIIYVGGCRYFGGFGKAGICPSSLTSMSVEEEAEEVLVEEQTQEEQPKEEIVSDAEMIESLKNDIEQLEQKLNDLRDAGADESMIAAVQSIIDSKKEKLSKLTGGEETAPEAPAEEETSVEEAPAEEEVEEKVAVEENVSEEEAPVEEEVSVEKETEGLPTFTFVEGELASFPDLKATDPDGDPIEYTFSEPFDENGEWQTKEGDAGKYVVTITASDGVLSTSQDVLVIVESKNKAPVLEEIEDIEVDEGDTVKIVAKATDPDGDDVTIKYSGWMTSDTKKTGYDDAGEHFVTVTASDGKKETSQKVKVIVNNVNRAPVFEKLKNVAVIEGDTVVVEPEVYDPDGDEVTISFEEPLDEFGEWQTKEGDAGTYTVTVTASDGSLATEKEVTIIVNSLNAPPVINIDKEIEVTEGDTVVLEPEVSDPDGDDVTVEYSGWMTSSTKQTGYDDAGVYEVTITASDGKAKSKATVKITVLDKNRPPCLCFGTIPPECEDYC
ncbi:cadherin repeat domain-containing protein [Candidatus Woesearchaeota archaeon]|nr:MAG: cadherin repeat domain-containing protein [Candidatus Woesearchaeota archaeon]